MRRRFGWLLAVIVAASCSAAGPMTEVPGASVPPSPTPRSSSQSPLPSSSPAESPHGPVVSPTLPASPATAGPLTVGWQADDPTGVAWLVSIVGVARAAGVHVLVGATGYGGEETSSAAAWWSTDGKAWQLAQEFPTGEDIRAVTLGGPGFVAGGRGRSGATVWTSTDGRSWDKVDDASLNGNGIIDRLVPTSSGLVAFGWDGATDESTIWTSPDGIDWLAATNDTGLQVARGLQAVGSFDGRAIAFVAEGEDRPVAIWETTGRAEWARTGSLTTGARVERVSGGSRGWVAIGSNLAWTSVDGRHWATGVGGPDVASDLVADDAGFVAVGWVGSLPGETCGDQRPFAGHTWTSSDGRSWQQMPIGPEFTAAMVTRLLIVDRTLVGYGQRLAGADGLMPVGRWTAPLPAASRSAETSDEASLPESCGG